MANYECCSVTNNFNVTDKKRLEDIVIGIPGAMLYHNNNADKPDSFMIVCYDSVNLTFPAAEDGGYDYEHEQDTVDEIQKILPDNEAVIIMEVGSEKCMPTAYATVITNKTVAGINLAEAAKDLAFDLTGKVSYGLNF